jgi:hypothetical protein
MTKCEVLCQRVKSGCNTQQARRPPHEAQQCQGGFAALGAHPGSYLTPLSSHCGGAIQTSTVTFLSMPSSPIQLSFSVSYRRLQVVCRRPDIPRLQAMLLINVPVISFAGTDPGSLTPATVLPFLQPTFHCFVLFIGHLSHVRLFSPFRVLMDALHQCHAIFCTALALQRSFPPTNSMLLSMRLSVWPKTPSK